MDQTTPFIPKSVQEKIDKLEQLKEEKLKVASGFDNNELPDYLVTYFDEKEETLRRGIEVVRRNATIKYSRMVNSPEERAKVVQYGKARFWELNKYCLKKTPRTVGSHLEPVFEEPPRNTEVAKLEAPLSPEERAILKNICSDDLYAFAIRYFKHYLKKPSSSLHKFLYNYLSTNLNKKRRKKGLKTVVAAPRSGAKSTLISTILPLWCICYSKKHFILMLSDTASSAEDFLSDIKNELLFNEVLKLDFPDVCGKGDTWRANEIITKNNIKVLALGTGNQVRGRRFGIYRPDLVVCHKEGTKILHKGEWIPIEEHPSAVKVIGRGLEIKIWGLPHSETVTKEHRYWCRKIQRYATLLDNNKYKRHSTLSEPFWCEAKDLDKDCYIGSPINYENGNLEKISFYKPSISERDPSSGRVLSSKTRQHIEDGFLWRKVREVQEKEKDEIFVPIKTDDSTYITSFGLSHNCDDLESGSSVRSKAERDFIRNQWFDKDLMFVGGDELTDFLVVGTVLGKESLLNALLNPSEYPEWASYKFQAVKKFSTSPLWDDWRKIFLNRLDSEREKKALDFFLEHKEEMLEGTEVLWPEGDPYYTNMVYKCSNPSGFTSEKMNQPVDPSKILVSKEQLHFEHFVYPQWQEILERCDYYGALDPALGKHANYGDYSCICTLARDPISGYLFVVNFDLKRRKVEQQIEAIIKNDERYDYKLFGVETNAFQYVVADDLRKKSRKEGAYIRIKEIHSSSDKKLRLEGIVPLMLDGTIVFDADKYYNSNQYSLAVDQITSYTGEGNSEDDAFDSLEMCVQIAKKSRFRILTHQTR